MIVRNLRTLRLQSHLIAIRAGNWGRTTIARHAVRSGRRSIEFAAAESADDHGSALSGGAVPAPHSFVVGSLSGLKRENTNRAGKRMDEVTKYPPPSGMAFVTQHRPPRGMDGEGNGERIDENRSHSNADNVGGGKILWHWSPKPFFVIESFIIYNGTVDDDSHSETNAANPLAHIGFLSMALK